MVTDGNSIYHAWQTRYEHRFFQGLSVTADYAWSHMIDDQGRISNRGACTCQDPRLRGKAERASSVFDVRRSALWWAMCGSFPSWNLKGPAALLLKGWEAGGIVTMQSGLPFNITQSGDSENVDGLWERPNYISGQSIHVSNPNAADWFNTAAFARATLAYGTSTRDPVQSDGHSPVRSFRYKIFKMPYNERHQLMFRAELFNAFNTPQLGTPGAVLGTGTFGVVTSTAVDQREVQFALKYNFKRCNVIVCAAADGFTRAAPV